MFVSELEYAKLNVTLKNYERLQANTDNKTFYRSKPAFVNYTKKVNFEYIKPRVGRQWVKQTNSRTKRLYRNKMIVESENPEKSVVFFPKTSQRTCQDLKAGKNGRSIFMMFCNILQYF